jgi:putative copper resistance protein D
VVASVGLPPLRGSELFSTQFNAVPLVMILAALGLYLWGVRKVNARYPRHPWPAGKTAAFVGGLVVTGLAVLTFIGVYQQELFYDHMIQHLMLIMMAAPLFVVASPIDLAWRATTGGARSRLARVLRSRLSELVGHPVFAFVLYAVVIPLTHLTSWFNYTIEQPSVDDFEHLVFLGAGYLFWRHIFGSDPNRYRLHPAAKFLYLFLAIPIDTFTGLALDQASRELFPAYYAFHRSWGPSPVEDLHIGGVIMWVGGDILMSWPMVPVALGWMHLEERRAERADRALDALEPVFTGAGGIDGLHRAGGDGPSTGFAP